MLPSRGGIEHSSLDMASNSARADSPHGHDPLLDVHDIDDDPDPRANMHANQIHGPTHNAARPSGRDGAVGNFGWGHTGAQYPFAPPPGPPPLPPPINHGMGPAHYHYGAPPAQGHVPQQAYAAQWAQYAMAPGLYAPAHQYHGAQYALPPPQQAYAPQYQQYAAFPPHYSVGPPHPYAMQPAHPYAAAPLHLPVPLRAHVPKPRPNPEPSRGGKHTCMITLPAYYLLTYTAVFRFHCSVPLPGYCGQHCEARVQRRD